MILLGLNFLMQHFTTNFLQIKIVVAPQKQRRGTNALYHELCSLSSTQWHNSRCEWCMAPGEALLLDRTV